MVWNGWKSESSCLSGFIKRFVFASMLYALCIHFVELTELGVSGLPVFWDPIKPSEIALVGCSKELWSCRFYGYVVFDSDQLITLKVCEFPRNFLVSWWRSCCFSFRAFRGVGLKVTRELRLTFSGVRRWL